MLYIMSRIYSSLIYHDHCSNQTLIDEFQVAAQNCRKRKIEVITSLDDEVLKMRNERDRLARERRALEKEMGEMREKFGHMYKEVFR